MQATPANTDDAEPVVYDESWTVTALKAAAKDRGISGYSAMSKSELIDALNA